MKQTLTVLALTTVLASGLAPGAQAASFTDFVGFGDSLSDKGRLAPELLTVPSNDGRFTDGTTWMEQVGEAFEARGGQNVNLALGGATAGPQNDFDDLYVAAEFFKRATTGPRDRSDPDDIPIPLLRNFNAQINSFFRSGFLDTLGENPLVGVLMGPNDLLQADAQTPSQIESVVDTVTDSVIGGIRRIYNTSNTLDDFFLANVPDATLGPLGTDLTDDEILLTSFGIDLFNTTLAEKAAALEGEINVSIEIFDFAASFENAIEAGLELGLIGDEACVSSLTTDDFGERFGSFLRCERFGDSSDYLFADQVHPNSFIHDFIAADALAQLEGHIAPVSLPASLPIFLFGLAALGMVRTRRRG